MSSATEQGLIHRVQAIRLATDELRKWMQSPSVLDISDADRDELAASLQEIEINLDKLEADPSVLTVVFLGGTGVGKSTLLNALAAARIASSGVRRPTTQFSTVYHHAEVDISALPEPFRVCKAAPHEHSELRQKILIDTPDVDGSVPEHHERLKEILPVADAILYIGSAEKYHDRAVWQLLLEHAPTRGFAFVLNKWDRCLAGRDEKTGRAPDEDLRRSLHEAGFHSPILFRICGKQWEIKRVDGVSELELIPDDFMQLVGWLESGLDERTIRDIKARGIANELEKIIAIVNRIMPPDWESKKDHLGATWREALRAGVTDQATLLIDSTDRQSNDLERHFGRLGREGIGGLFGIYLHLVDRLKHLRGALIPMPTGEKKKTEMQRIAAKCVDGIPGAVQSIQREAMRDRLLSLADREGWSIDVLTKILAEDSKDRPIAEWNEASLARILTTELRTLEKDYADPRGSKRAIHALVRLLCTWAPLGVLAAIGVSLLYSLFSFQFWGVGEFFSAMLLFGITIAALHLLLVWVFPVKWESLREKLRSRLEFGLLDQVMPRYWDALERYTSHVMNERKLLMNVQSVLKTAHDQLERTTGNSASSLFAEKSHQADHSNS